MLNKKMTPEQLLKLSVIKRGIDLYKITGFVVSEINVNNIDGTADAFQEMHEDAWYDGKSEIRGGEVETGLKSECSRHYESKSVAANIEGIWVGWTYWYGGGKYGEPESIDWMNDAYFLECQEEEKVVTVRTFTKLEIVDVEFVPRA